MVEDALVKPASVGRRLGSSYPDACAIAVGRILLPGAGLERQEARNQSPELMGFVVGKVATHVDHPVLGNVLPIQPINTKQKARLITCLQLGARTLL